MLCKTLHSQPEFPFIVKSDMKNFNSVATAILALGLIILYFLHFKGETTTGKKNNVAAKDSLGTSVSMGPIAYFEMDSIEQHYLYIKDVQAKLKTKEQAISGELEGMRKGYMGRVQQLQSKAPTMSQSEGEAAQAEITQMERNLQQKEARMAQDLQEQQFKLMQDINKKIETYLADYNKNRGFSYIFSRQAGDFIYFRDTVMNITSDLVKGLNEDYVKEQKQGKEEKKD
jgi:outer membrane protein